MKTKVLLFFCFFICNLLSAQNMKLNITPHSFSTHADSLVLSMDVSISIENMETKNAVVITPILTAPNQKVVLLPSIQLNGKQKQKLYLRNQLLRKKSSKSRNSSIYLTEGVGENFSRTIAYHTSLPAEAWMNEATLSLRRCIIKPEGEHFLRDTLLLTQQSSAISSYLSVKENITPTVIETPFRNPGITKMKYKGSYLSPEADEIDARNQKELNFNLEEAKTIADINPQMLSLRELYTVALSYADDRAKFYQLIHISVKLYPVHPVANLNAAAAAIEMGDSKAASKFLSMASHDGLAYKNCRGVYELMTGNTYEGIRMLKAAKSEGSEEATYNLSIFFENSKRP